jgi:hypothetical protein
MTPQNMREDPPQCAGHGQIAPIAPPVMLPITLLGAQRQCIRQRPPAPARPRQEPQTGTADRRNQNGPGIKARPAPCPTRPDARIETNNTWLHSFPKDRGNAFMATDIFLSVGSTASQAQEDFVQAMETRLRAEGLTPNTVGRNTFSVDSPLRTIQHLMSTCQGAVVLALERSYFPEGCEKRGGPKEKALSEIRLATPWNQIEAAIAYSRGMPLLVIVEEGLQLEGLLEPGYDWYVQTISLAKPDLSSAEFNGVLASWKQKLQSAGATPKAITGNPDTEIDKMTVGQLIGALRPTQLWSLVLTFGAMLGAAFSLGAKLIP